MIYTVTLNPTLDITYVIEEVIFGEPVRALEVVKSPGGKGINVSRALRAIGTDSVALCTVGGYEGEEVLGLLHDEGLIIQTVKIDNETRTNVVILGRSDKRELVIRSAGPAVSEREVERIVDVIFRIAETPEVLVLSGSLPPGMNEDIYHMLIVEGKRRGSKVVLDSAGRPFAAGLEAAPYMIKPNLLELEELAGSVFHSDERIIEFCRALNAKGVEIAVVSKGREGALMVTGDTVLSGTVPELDEDTVGAGDSMVAGMVSGLVQEKPLEEIFRLGLACSVSAIMNRGPGLAEPETLEDALQAVAVEKLDM
jgi:1-phosphofructokinase family hexose kinase